MQNDFRKWMRLVETSEPTVPVLYHGTCPDNAAALAQHGWQPRSGPSGGNQGQSRYLYLSTDREDALWFAQEKGCNVVIDVRDVPMSSLIVDPEDGTADTLEGELNLSHRLPGKVALTKPLSADHFHLRLLEADIITEASNFRIGLTDVFRLVNRAQLLNLLKRYPVLRGWVGRDGITWVWNAGDLDHSSAQMEMPSSVNIAVIFRSKNAGEEELAQAEISDFDGEDQGEFSFHAACWEARDCYNFARFGSPVLRRILRKPV